MEVGEGDILVFRTGHHARRLALGPWSNDPPPVGQGKAGLHVDTVPWMHERKVAAFLPDGDGETVPSNVEDMPYPIHPLQLTAMGMCVSNSLNLEDLATACQEEGRFEFMVVGLPLRLPGATFELRATIEHRGALVIRADDGPLRADVTNTDPAYRREGHLGVALETFDPVVVRAEPAAIALQVRRRGGPGVPKGRAPKRPG